MQTYGGAEVLPRKARAQRPAHEDGLGMLGMKRAFPVILYRVRIYDSLHDVHLKSPFQVSNDIPYTLFWLYIRSIMP